MVHVLIRQLFFVSNLYLSRKTLHDSICETALEYCGAIGPNPENIDALKFHASLLLGQIASLDQVDAYHRAFPWKVAQALDHSSWATLLASMKGVWQFVVEVHDKLRSTEVLYKELMICRFQVFRDLFVKAE